MKKSYIVMIVVTIISIVLAIVLRVLMDHIDIQYEEVKATVISAESQIKVSRKYTYTDYNVKVAYEGDTYELKNVTNTYSYMKGKVITAYLSNGELYANIAGVRGSTPVATAYFVFVFISLALIIATPAYIITSKKRNT